MTCVVYIMFLSLQGGLVAVGTDKGFVQIWDVAMNKRITTLDGHSARVGEYRVYSEFASLRYTIQCITENFHGAIIFKKSELSVASKQKYFPISNSLISSRQKLDEFTEMEL